MKDHDYDRPRSRKAKRSTRKRLLIVTEGEVTEVEYFEALKLHLELQSSQLDVVVEAGPDHEGNTPSRVVRSAVKLRETARKRQKNRDKLGDLEARIAYDQVWVVFDTEREGKNADLFSAAEHALDKGLYVAISRPSFESWFLLHLREGLPAMATCDDACKKISQITRRKYSREYQKDSKDNADLLWLIDTILPFTTDAVDRGKIVAKIAFMTHEAVPDTSGTKVYELVEVLWQSSPLAFLELETNSPDGEA